MSKDANPLAMKADIDQVMEAISNLYDATEKWKDELCHHFDIAFENHHLDVIDAFGDRYESLREVQRRHGQRLNRIEAELSMPV